MISTKELSALLATLYAAPLEPENWQVFFDHLCTLTDTSSGYMVSVRPEAGNVLLAGGGLNFDLETLHLYNEHYGANDPYTAPVMANPRVGIIPGEELVNRSDLVRSELYNELLRPFNLEHMTLVSCSWSTEEAVLFPLWRSAKQGSMKPIQFVSSNRFSLICRQLFGFARRYWLFVLQDSSRRPRWTSCPSPPYWLLAKVGCAR